MSFQDILEISQSIGVNDHRVVGQQVSRSGQVTVAQYVTAVPFVFTVKPHNFLYYPQARKILNDLRILDRQIPDSIYFNSINLKWFTANQGQLTTLQYNSLQLNAIPAANSTIFVMKNLPSVSAGTIIFKEGDYVMVGSYPYIVTNEVDRGSGTTVNVNVHRPIIIDLSVTVGSVIYSGNNVSFYVMMESYPTYTLIPMTNGAWIQWDSDFVFREAIGQP